MTLEAGIETVTITAHPLTVEGFRPFGTAIGILERPEPDVVGASFVGWYPLGDVAATNPLQFGVVVARPLGGPLTVMEVHAERAECAFATDAPVVLAVAHSTPDGASPDASTVRAFVVAPGEGVILPPGIWHAAGAPVGDEPVRYLFALAQPVLGEANRGWVPFAGGKGIVIDTSAC